MPMPTHTLTPAEADYAEVDVLVEPDISGKLILEKRPGTCRYYRDGIEVFNYTPEEALKLMREGWTKRV